MVLCKFAGLKSNLLDVKYLKYVENLFEEYINQTETSLNVTQNTRNGKNISPARSRFYPGEEAFDLVKFPDDIKEG